MLYSEFRPSYPLNQFIDSLYYVNAEMGSAEKVILPDFKTDLIFLFETSLTCLTGTFKTHDLKASAVNGFRQIPLRFRYNGHTELLGIRFLPLGFTQLFNISQNELSDFIAVDDLPDHRMYREVADRLTEEIDPFAKFRIVESWLLDALAKRKIKTNLSIRAINRISETHGILSLTDICNNSPSEYKQLQRFCHQTFNMGPKKYARMVRFEHIHKYLSANRAPEWLSLVANFEFTDQSHLIREIKQFTGQTPKEFLSDIQSYI